MTFTCRLFNCQFSNSNNVHSYNYRTSSFSWQSINTQVEYQFW